MGQWGVGRGGGALGLQEGQPPEDLRLRQRRPQNRRRRRRRPSLVAAAAAAREKGVLGRTRIGVTRHHAKSYENNFFKNMRLFFLGPERFFLEIWAHIRVVCERVMNVS